MNFLINANGMALKYKVNMHSLQCQVMEFYKVYKVMLFEFNLRISEKLY